MARCLSCSAPMPANQNRCLYCNTRNDVDLKGKQHFHTSEHPSSRVCPHCQIELQTVVINQAEPLSIERCNQCFGLFFDPGELETYLETSVSGVFDINLEHIKNINEDRYRTRQKVKYIQCPVCELFMNRINFGHRSGVIVDRCKNHGVWLDNGELTHLLEWKKAGGQLLHEREKKRTRQKKASQQSVSKAYKSQADQYYDPLSYDLLDQDLISSISKVIFKLFN